MSDPDDHPSPTAPAVLMSNRQTGRSTRPALAGSRAPPCAGEGLRDAELSVSFVDEAEIEDLHVRYMDEPGPTDVLSFPLDDVDEGGRACSATS